MDESVSENSEDSESEEETPKEITETAIIQKNIDLRNQLDANFKEMMKKM